MSKNADSEKICPDPAKWSVSAAYNYLILLVMEVANFTDMFIFFKVCVKYATIKLWQQSSPKIFVFYRDTPDTNFAGYPKKYFFLKTSLRKIHVFTIPITHFWFIFNDMTVFIRSFLPPNKNSRLTGHSGLSGIRTESRLVKSGIRPDSGKVGRISVNFCNNVCQSFFTVFWHKFHNSIIPCPGCDKRSETE